MIKLGIIGYNKGNGHPYSYSSIFNGFDEKFMKDCPYPSIPEYLKNHDSDIERLNSAQVTHIWTQDREISTHIAQASKINNIVNNFEDMIPEVDAIIIARDDYEEHMNIAKPIIKAGLNVFIDKPLEFSVIKAKEILDLEKFSGQIFSSSSLAYDPRVISARKNLKSIGDIKYIYGSAPGRWDRYAIHLIDTLLMILDNKFSFKTKNIEVIDGMTLQTGMLDNNAYVELRCMGGRASPLRVTIVGTNGFFDIDFKDPFYAFKNTLDAFVTSVIKKKVERSHEDIIKSISLIELF